MSKKKINTKEDGLYVWIEITGKCNLKCPYCYAASSVQKNKNEFSDKELFTLLTNLKKCGAKGVVLSGGEPVLRKKIEKILEFGSKKLGLKMMLVSNGTLIHASLLKCLKKNNVTVQLSLDSVDPKTFLKSRGLPVLSQVLKNIDTFLKNHIDITLSSTITKLNHKRIMEVVKYAKEKNIQNVHVGEFVPFGRGKLNKKIFLSQNQHFNVLRDLYEYQKDNFLFVSIDTIENLIYPIVFKQKRMTYCNPTLQVDNKGNIEYCVNIPSKNPKNILVKGADKIISDMRKQYKKSLVSIKNIKGCRQCPNATICAGGCRAIPFNYYEGKNSLTRKHPYCRSYKKIIDLINLDKKTGKLNEYFDFLRKSIPQEERKLKRFF